ncbi:hypothetical protein [Marinicellulosiphila megalodicopiae]|uniref:hypothetical protein n=1 Tax=Marinicellulosiphila megalodicopiae TaxID=2724896 RepID=UPI003BAFAADD
MHKLLLKHSISLIVFASTLTSCLQEDKITEVGFFANQITFWNLSQEDELLAYTKLQIKTYQGDNFKEVTNGETHSSVSNDKIRVWVTSDQAEQYKSLNSDSSFPIGSTVIRVLYNEDNEATKITATVKADKGSNPMSNDWVFAVANTQGVVEVDEHGKWQFGAIESCNMCHTHQDETDGLFGL